PDPWTFTEPGYPESVNRLLELPRYVSKNYLHLSPLKVINDLARLLGTLALSKTRAKLIAELPHVIKSAFKFKFESFVFISFADYLLTSLFLEYRQRYNPDFNLLFVNGLAHLQHHHWYDENYESNE